ncbi:MAG TPA: TldD/PmbA family protein [Anaerolineae bacterium]|nr:TldD/PmbA family protein [Anaerolineae bacterium]
MEGNGMAKKEETRPPVEGKEKQNQDKVRDEYWQLTEDFAQIVRRAEQSYQEKAPGRGIDFISLFMGSRSGIICTADEEGIPQIIVTGEETDNQGRKKTQRFFIGLQAEVATKDTAFLTVNLAEDETTVKEFEVSSQGHNLVKQAIERAKKRGEKIQRKIDEENYEWFPYYHVEGQEVSINEDVDPKVNLDLVVSLVATGRQVIKNELGAKVDKIRVNFVKWTENFEYADTEGTKIDHIVPRLGFTIQVKTKDGSEAFGAIRGAMGGMEILGRYGNVEREKGESDADYYQRVVTELAKEVAKEAIDLDRAQGASILGTECPVILSPQVTGALVHEVYGHTSEGDIICENRRSKTAQLTLKSRIGAQVSDYPNFTIIDTGAAEIKLGKVKIKHPFGGLIVDEHGCPAKETVLIERGIQVNVLNDRYTFNEIVDGLKEEIVKGMKKHGLTGSVRREKYDMPPQVRMTNTYLLPDEKGPQSLEEMAARIPKNKKGVYIKTCKGAWVSPDDGTFAINGNLCYLIENGQVTDKPIREVRVTGNIAKFVDSIKAVGASKTIDRTFTGYCGKANQWVPVEGGGPLVYIEDAKLGKGRYRPWSELVEEYHRQHDQVLKGQRDEEGIYLPEFAEEMGEDVPQAQVCLLTATLPGREERDWIMGRRDRAKFVLRNGELMERGEWFE